MQRLFKFLDGIVRQVGASAALPEHQRVDSLVDEVPPPIEDNVTYHMRQFIESTRTAYECLQYECTLEQLYTLNTDDIDMAYQLDCRKQDYQQALGVLFMQIASICNPKYQAGGSQVVMAKEIIKEARNKVYARKRYEDFPTPEDTSSYGAHIHTIIQAYKRKPDRKFMRQLGADFFAVRKEWGKVEPEGLYERDRHLVTAYAYQLVAS